MPFVYLLQVILRFGHLQLSRISLGTENTLVSICSSTFIA